MNSPTPKAPPAPRSSWRPRKAYAGSGWIFAGIAIGAAVKLLVSLFFLLPDTLIVPLGFLPRAELAMELAPALIGVGFILGYRQSAVCVAGSLLSSLALIPLIAWVGSGLTGPLAGKRRVIADMSSEAIWKNYVRYIGGGGGYRRSPHRLARIADDALRLRGDCPRDAAQGIRGGRQ